MYECMVVYICSAMHECTVVCVWQHDAKYVYEHMAECILQAIRDTSGGACSGKQLDYSRSNQFIMNVSQAT